MNAPAMVRTLLNKMPEDVTLVEIIRWVDVLDVAGVDSPSEFKELDKDLAAFFSKKKRSPAPKNLGDAKKRALHVLSILPDDVELAAVLNRLVLVRRIEQALEELARGEGMDHDEFFKQLDDNHEENARSVVARRPKRPAGNTKADRKNRPVDRRKIRPAS